jgi:hypothetical protein
MLLFSVWTSLYYILLAKYTKNSDSAFLEYTQYSFGFFFVWPILQLFGKCCCRCFCKSCNKDDPEKDDEFNKVEEMMEVGHKHDHDHGNDKEF